MDNRADQPTSDRSDTLQWSTPTGLVATGGIGTALCAVLAVFTGQITGTLLFAIVALALALMTAQGLRARPRLSVDASGIAVRALMHAYRWDHGQVRVFLRTTRRFGRDNQLLELDGIDVHGEERLVLLGRIDLGADPADVCDRIDQLRSRR